MHQSPQVIMVSFKEVTFRSIKQKHNLKRFEKSKLDTHDIQNSPSLWQKWLQNCGNTSSFRYDEGGAPRNRKSKQVMRWEKQGANSLSKTTRIFSNFHPQIFLTSNVNSKRLLKIMNIVRKISSLTSRLPRFYALLTCLALFPDLIELSWYVKDKRTLKQKLKYHLEAFYKSCSSTLIPRHQIESNATLQNAK